MNFAASVAGMAYEPAWRAGVHRRTWWRRAFLIVIMTKGSSSSCHGRQGWSARNGRTRAGHPHKNAVLIDSRDIACSEFEGTTVGTGLACATRGLAAFALL
jgi:hypothetical protein